MRWQVELVGKAGLHQIPNTTGRLCCVSTQEGLVSDWFREIGFRTLISWILFKGSSVFWWMMEGLTSADLVIYHP